MCLNFFEDTCATHDKLYGRNSFNFTHELNIVRPTRVSPSWLILHQSLPISIKYMATNRTCSTYGTFVALQYLFISQRKFSKFLALWVLSKDDKPRTITQVMLWITSKLRNPTSLKGSHPPRVLVPPNTTNTKFPTTEPN